MKKLVLLLCLVLAGGIFALSCGTRYYPPKKAEAPSNCCCVYCDTSTVGTRCIVQLMPEADCGGLKGSCTGTGCRR